MKTNLLAALALSIFIGGVKTANAAAITINPSDDGALYTCADCNTVNNGGYVLVAGYIQGIVIFPTAPITAPVAQAVLTVNPYGLPLFGLDVDVYGILESGGSISASDANAGTYLGTMHLPSNLGYGQDASFDVTPFVAGAKSPYLGFNLRDASGSDVFSSLEYNYGHPSQLQVTFGTVASTGPIITNQPMSQVVTEGGTATFTVGATGTGTLSYQWSVNTTNILGATNATLTLNNVQPTDAGTYAVLVGDANGFALSSNALLNVNPPVESCDPVPTGIVGWWPGEGNGDDIIGGDNGLLQGGAGFAPGKVGQGFRFDGTNGYVQIPDSAALKPANVTCEAWVWLDPNLPSGRGGEQIIFKKNTWSAWFEGYSLLKATIDNGNGTYSDRFQFCISRSGNQVAINSQTIAQRGVWYHVAGTYDGNTSRLYVNGVMEASAVAGFALDYDTTPIYIGTSGTWAPYLSMFAGIIDEPSIYNRALSQSEIQSIYNAASAGKCMSAFAVPVISGIAPESGTNGALVTITGTNFSGTASADIVYFGAVRASVASASPTSLVVTVPVGATFAPISVTVNGLTTFSDQPFLPTFAGGGFAIDASSFAPRLDLPCGKGPNQTVIADLDGDGKPDLIVANDYNNTISLYRNLSTTGSLTAASFAPPVNLTTPPGNYSPYGIAVADLDGDGKLDVIATDFDGTNLVSVYRNTCGTGNFTSNSFAPRVDFVTGSHPQGVAVADVDGDGRPDLLVANTGDGTVSVFRNTSVPGSLTENSFTPKIDVATGAGCDNVTTGDLDGDGRPDVVTANPNGNTVSLLHNVSTPGQLVFDSKADFATPNGPLHVKLVDLDGDGKPDVVVECYLSQTMSAFRNTSTIGTLNSNSLAARTDFPLGGRGHTTAVGDLNGDGKPDLAVVTELSSLMSVFQNNGSPGTFTADSLAARVDFGTGWNAWGVSVGDLDGDGRPDVVFCNSYDNTISIYRNLVPFGAPPVITSQPTNEVVTVGGTATFSVGANGTGPLSYQWSMDQTNLSGATNGTLTLNDVQDGDAGTYSVTVSNAYGSTNSAYAVLRINHPPVADASATLPLVISINNSNATVVLNGSLSSDPDGDALQYTWYLTGEVNPLASGVVAVVVLPVGTNSITLAVNDGLASSRQTIAVAVVTTAQAVNLLQDAVNASGSGKQSLIASLNAALAAIDRSNPVAAINQLEAFQNQVKAQIAALDASLAQSFIDAAQSIINALTATGGNPHQKLQAASGQGKVHLNFAGVAQQTYIIESSTNLVDWEMIGVAKDQGDGTFNFDDTVSPQVPGRFYRVVTP